MSNIGKYIFVVGMLSFGLRIVTDYLALKYLQSEFKDEYEKTGKPSFLWSDNRWFIYFGYLLRKKYKNINNKRIIKLFGISRFLLIAFFVSVALFFILGFVYGIA